MTVTSPPSKASRRKALSRSVADRANQKHREVYKAMNDEERRAFNKKKNNTPCTQKVHKCPKCLREVKGNGSFERHTASCGGQDGPFKCPEADCDSAFYRKDHLKKHGLVHAPASLGSFECKPCNQTLRCHGSYQAHLKSKKHHKIMGTEQPRPFKCTNEGCEKAFNRNPVMVSHRDSKCEHRE